MQHGRQRPDPVCLVQEQSWPLFQPRLAPALARVLAAARVLGASTPRILFRHLLPNSVAIVVTLIPFSVSGLVLSLTALDYLGFGLPPKYATWGKLLQDGIGNLSSPWLVTCAFGALVFMLVLVTFVGEAVREAFDPKKFTYYR